MISIRNARAGDREPVLSFCANTFSWGDYIDQVWDLWLNDNQGRLLVAESEGEAVGLSHVAACPDLKSIWLEGVRVRPSHRRARIATALIDKMLRYGKEEMGSAQALAIVARDNIASQRMMSSNGFSVISEWVYHSTDGRMDRRPSSARIASEGETGAIMKYLEGSRIYKHSAKMYVRSWHWYALDGSSVRDLVSQGRIVVSGEPVAGVAVINRAGYWSRKNILQIVYLDSHDPQALSDLLSFVCNIYVGDRYERLHVLCSQDGDLVSAIDRFSIQESEQFLLYNKVIS